MNLRSIFEELDKLYEDQEVSAKKSTADEKSEEAGSQDKANKSLEEGPILNAVGSAVGSAAGSFVGTAAANALTEEDESVEEGFLSSAAGSFVGTATANMLTEDSEEEAEEAQLVLECANCGALVVKAEATVVVDEESDLANVEEPCQYCEEVAGYKILGVLAPYGTEEDPEVEIVEDEEDEESEEAEDEVVEEALEEGIFDSKEKKAIAYNKEIEKVFDDSCVVVVSDICSNVIGMLHDATENTGDQEAFKANVKQLVQNAEQAVKAKKGQRVIDRVVAFGQREVSNSNALDKLMASVDKMNELKRIPKIGAEVHAYFNDKLNAELATELREFQASGISEELNEFLDADINLNLDGGEGNDVSVLGK